MARYELLIHARRAVVDGRIQKAAIAVDGGIISSVRTGAEARDIGLAGEHTIDLGDDIVLLAGLVDPHVSIEDVAVATRSAALGGVTTAIDYGSESSPAAVNAADVAKWRTRINGDSSIDLGLWGTATPGSADTIGLLVNSGVAGVTAAVASAAAPGSNALNPTELVATAHQVLSSGARFAVVAGPTDLPPLLDVLRHVGGSLHLRSVADAATVRQLRDAKNERLPVTAATSPHLLALVSEVTHGGVGAAHLDAPIRDAATRELLWDALRDGTIDAVASARLGLSVVWTEARRRGFDLADVARWMAQNPASIVGLADRGEIRVGRQADLTAVADDEAFVVLPESRELGLADSVYAQRALAGVVRWTMVRGTMIDPKGLPRGTTVTIGLP